MLREHTDLAVRLAGHDYRITTSDGRSVYTIRKDERRSPCRSAGPSAWARSARRTCTRRTAASTRAARATSTPPAASASRPAARSRPLAISTRRRGGRYPTRRRAAASAATRPRPPPPAPSTSRGLVPGVTCEACHGPGAKHVAAVEQGRLAEVKPSMANPRRSDPAVSVDFCGACHATWWDVTLAGEKGIAALRSQPFRLQSSRCWGGKAMPRLTCVACHDPHRPLEREAVAYDARCLACHSAGGKTAGVAPPGSARSPRRGVPSATCRSTRCRRCASSSRTT